MNNDINDANNKWAQSIGIREETHDIKPWKYEYLYPYDSNLPKLSDQQNKMESDAGVNYKQCKICKRSFTQLKSLKEHMKTIHEERRDHKCYLCPKRFTQSKSVKVHIRTVHEGIKAHQCSICNKTFTQGCMCSSV